MTFQRTLRCANRLSPAFNTTFFIRGTDTDLKLSVFFAASGKSSTRPVEYSSDLNGFLPPRRVPLQSVNPCASLNNFVFFSGLFQKKLPVEKEENLIYHSKVWIQKTESPGARACARYWQNQYSICLLPTFQSFQTGSIQLKTIKRSKAAALSQVLSVFCE